MRSFFFGGILKLNKVLPKFSKRWEKERELSGIRSIDNGIYLILENDKMASGHESINLRAYMQLKGEVGSNYFFELFKYLKRYQAYSIMEIVVRHKLLNTKKEVRNAIKVHLVKNFHKIKINETKENKIPTLTYYLKLVDECLDQIDGHTKISLVFQKKIGYKYYENVRYY